MESPQCRINKILHIIVAYQEELTGEYTEAEGRRAMAFMAKIDEALP